MRKPDFFLIGAPKCGTSSMAAWLAQHPAIYMSPEKEPHFFSPDHGPRGVPDLAAYEALFAGAGPAHAAVGEASTRYLFSRAAVPAILDYAPAARFIVMLRNPLQMAPSLHQHNLYQANEQVEDFGRAWHLQGERMQGRHVPALCIDARLLQYGPICRLGEQLERLHRHVAPSRVLALFLEDVKADPAAGYARVLQFLGVPGHVPDFRVVNQAQAPRSRALRFVLRSVAMAFRRSGLRRPRSGILAPLYRANTRPASVTPLTAAMRAELADYFRDDIARLAALTGRDLSHWLR